MSKRDDKMIGRTIDGLTTYDRVALRSNNVPRKGTYHNVVELNSYMQYSEIQHNQKRIKKSVWQERSFR